MFNLSSIYSARKSSNHKLSINHKISHDTNLHKTKHTNIRHKTFEELVPSVSPLLKKHIRLGHAGIVDNRHTKTHSLCLSSCTDLSGLSSLSMKRRMNARSASILSDSVMPLPLRRVMLGRRATSCSRRNFSFMA